MKRIFTFLILFFGFTIAHAQLAADDVVFWLGEGDQEAYFLVDFRDESEDPSFGWGIRFNEEDQVSMGNALALIAEADSGFTWADTGGFLNDIIYNHHQGLDSDPDWWSTWSGDAVDALGMQGGISETLSDGRWYGVSYGFTPVPVAPTFKNAAYSPDWFSLDDVEYWVGEGDDKAAITIDFVSDEENEVVSYVWGVKFDGSITGDQALETIAATDVDLEISIDATGVIESISYKGMERVVNATNSWKAFNGNSMSDYQPTLLDEVLTNNKLFGISFGDENVRRPYIPTPVEESDTPGLGGDDMVFWVGEGDQEAYVLIDFKDGTEDVSFGWGVRFNEEEDPTMSDVLDWIANADSGFSTEKTAFLSDIIYNHHEGIGGQPDYWSTWSGDAVDALGGQGGIGEYLTQGRWYGFSYGFNPMTAPTFKYAAYSPDWFSLDDVEYWFGEGENEAAITIAFVSDQNEEVVTYVWGVKFDGSITGDQALEMIADADADLEINIDETGVLQSVSYKGMERVAGATNSWRAFIGNSMSDYQPTLLDEVLTNNKLFGISFGDENVRRPYIPTAVEDPTLGVADIQDENSIKLWPNPASHMLYVESDQNIEDIRIYNMLGVEVLRTSSNAINVNALPVGTYIIKTTDQASTKTDRFIKR